MNLLKRVGTPRTLHGDAKKRFTQLRSGVLRRSHNFSARLSTWWHTPYEDHMDLGLEDF